MLKKILIPALSTMMVMPLVNAATVEERLSELELKQDTQIVKFGGRFFSSYDNVEYATRTATNGPVTTDTLNLMRLQFSLNFDANISSKLKFYGRYTTSKYFNHFQRTETLSGSTANTAINNSTGRDLGIQDNFEAGPATFLERAYLAYAMNDYVTFSVGRLPTVDGPPLNWEDGVSREGTYPHLAYSNVLDGAATTFNFSSFLPTNNQFFARLVYTPFSNVGTAATGNPGSLSANGKLASINGLYVGMLEYSTKGEKFGEFLAIGQALIGRNLQYLRTATDTLDGNYNTYSFYSHVTDIMHTGIDFSGTYFMSSYENTHLLGGTTGLYTNTVNDKKMGHAFLLTTRYLIPVKMLNSPSVGAEYIKGDKYFNKSDPTSHDVEGFYSTRGHGLHFYYSQPIETGLRLRFGYITKTDKYARGDTTGDINTAKVRDNKAKNIYAQVRLDF